MRKSRLVNIFQIVIVNILLLIGALINNNIIHVMGIVLLLFFAAVNSIENALLITIAFTPNLAIVVLNNDGMSFCGFLYLIILIKCIFNRFGKIKLKKVFLVTFIPLLIMGVCRVVFNRNIYDLLIFIEIFLILILFSNILRTSDIEYKKNMYDFFTIGTIVMTFNILVQGILNGYRDGRVTAVLDNANYTGMIYAILFICGLINFLYKIKIAYNMILCMMALLGVLLTGSRGAIVSIGVAFVWILFFGAKSKRIQQLILLFLGACAVVVVLYLAQVEMIVEIYNNTVLRTIELFLGSTEGAFLDVSSGRFYLWEYYWNRATQSQDILWFGQGMSNYYLPENGGCGIMAHNAYLASIIGNGIVGTICIIGIYLHFILKELKTDKTGITFLVIPITLAVGYIFLDGILDIRVPLYFVLMRVLYEINESELVKRTQRLERKEFE